MSSQTFVTFCTILLVSAAVGQQQRAVLFDQHNGQGNSISISQMYSSNLTSQNFDNQAKSVCVTGVWIFYEDPDFNPHGDRRVETVFGRDNYCVNIRTIPGSISSARYAGAPVDYTTDSLTIYKYAYFQGQEEYTSTDLKDLEHLEGNHQSIIITGNSHWTVFDEPNFRGNGVCLQVPKPGTHTPAFINDLQKNTNARVSYGSIRSVRKGCVSKFNVVMEPF